MTEFVYHLPHENWYAEMDDPREVNVTYRSDDLSVQVSFTFREHRFTAPPTGMSPTAVQLRMYGDSMAAFMALPNLFKALAEDPPSTVEDVVALLEDAGARDTTARDDPRPQAAALLALSAFRDHASPENARRAALALVDYADARDRLPCIDVVDAR